MITCLSHAPRQGPLLISSVAPNTTNLSTCLIARPILSGNHTFVYCYSDRTSESSILPLLMSACDEHCREPNSDTHSTTCEQIQGTSTGVWCGMTQLKLHHTTTDTYTHMLRKALNPPTDQTIDPAAPVPTEVVCTPKASNLRLH